MLNHKYEQGYYNKPLEQISNWTDMLCKPNGNIGSITVNKQLPSGEFLPKSYKCNSKGMKQLVRDTKGQKDVFFSINSFKYGRKSENLLRFNMIAVDVDCYKVGLTKEKTIESILEHVERGNIPMPNVIAQSRGIQLFWSIDGGVPPKMEWLTRFITESYIDTLDKLGADGKAALTTQLMRIPGSINNKNNENVPVTSKVMDNYAYNIYELRDCADKLGRLNYTPKKQSKQSIKLFKGKVDVSKVLTSLNRLNVLRLEDMEHLARTRGIEYYRTASHRNVFVYNYAFQMSLIRSTIESVKRAVYSNISEVLSHLDNKEVDKTIKSAFDGAKKFQTKFSECGYRINSKDMAKVVKPKLTKTIIKDLEITSEEMNELKTLNNLTKKERDNKRYEPIKQANAMKKSERDSKVIELRERGMKLKEIAESMGVSLSTVKNILRRKEG